MGKEDKSILTEILHVLKGLPENTSSLVQTVLFALAAGITVICFMLAIDYAYEYTYVAFSSRSLAFFMTMSFLLIMVTSLIVGILITKVSTEAGGSGIPQLKSVYWREMGYMPWKPVIVRFLAGVLSIGGGASLGREGPTVHLGGGIASCLAGPTGVPARQRRGAMVIGAAAGLAAAFNTPLAAITFVLEEILGDINSRFIGRVVLASLIGAFVVYAFIGRQPAFTLPSVGTTTWMHYLIVPLVALAASLTGVIFQRSVLALRSRLRHETLIPRWLMPCCGGFITWTIGVFVYCATGRLGVFGLGYHDLSSALANDFIWWVAGIMVVAKVLATVSSFAFGGCGGIFSPLLFIGGMCGYFLGGLVGLWVPLSPSDRIILSAVGMSSCLGAVVREPLTSLLITFEMTHQFSFIPALMTGTIISMIVGRAAGKTNFYDAILVQDGHEFHKIRPPLDIRAWQNLPISAITNHRPVTVETLEREALREVIEKYSYNGFPVVIGGVLKGLITRSQIEENLFAGNPIELEPAVTCTSDQLIREVADKFIESPAGIMVVFNRDSSKVAGVITLHDLLRAQASMME